MSGKTTSISRLLKEQRALQEEINRVKDVISSLNGELATGYNFMDGGIVGVYTSHREFRFSATKEVMLAAATAMLNHYETEIEPINKKLEAIELMLSS